MKRIKELEGFRKAIMILMAVMAVLFLFIYIAQIRKTGYNYRNSILEKTENNSTTVYSGKVSGYKTTITVNADKSIVFNVGEKVYGPYTVTDMKMLYSSNTSPDFFAYEIKDKDKTIFKGTGRRSGDVFLFYDDNGDFQSFGNTTVEVNGSTYDQNGNLIDKNEPTLFELVEIAEGPEMTHKGMIGIWFFGTFICLMNAISILFADELFRYYMRFRMSNPEDAIPSDWEIASRYICWFVLTFAALTIYLIGLLG